MLNRIDAVLLRILKPRVLVGGAVTLGLAALVTVIINSDRVVWWGAVSKRKLAAAAAAALVIGVWVAVGERSTDRRFARQGVDAEAELLQVEIAQADGQYADRLRTVGLLLRLAGSPETAPAVYRIFRLPVDQAEQFVAGTTRRVRVLPDDLSLLLMERSVGSGKPLRCRASRTPLAD